MDWSSEVKQGKGFKLATGIIVLLSLLAGLLAYPRLPEKVPSHWNAAGAIDGYTTAFKGAFLPPLLLLGIFVLFLVMPKIDPKKANYPKMGRVYWILGFAIILFLALMYMGTLAVALGLLPNLPRWYFSGIGILFIIIGNYFGKIKYNYYVGIRTPWTLAKEEVWYKTHRFAGPIWMIGGSLLLLSGFLPPSWIIPWFFTIMGVLIIVPTVYSYLLFQRLNK